MRAGKRRRIRDRTAFWDVMVALSVLLGVALLFSTCLLYSTIVRPWHYPHESVGSFRTIWAENPSFIEQPLTMFTVTLVALSAWLLVLFVTNSDRQRRLLPERLALAVGVMLILGMTAVTDDIIDIATSRYRVDKWEGTPFGVRGSLHPIELRRVYPFGNPDDRYWAQIGETWVFLPDADTVRINGHDYRLWGIDALQSEQICVTETNAHFCCGHRSRDAFLRLMSSVSPSEITCIFPDQARYPRTISCRTGGRDVAESLVRLGYAFPVGEGRYRYGEALQAARAEKAGAWATTFLHPSDWKAARCERIAGFCRKEYDAD